MQQVQGLAEFQVLADVLHVLQPDAAHGHVREEGGWDGADEVPGEAFQAGLVPGPREAGGADEPGVVGEGVVT